MACEYLEQDMAMDPVLCLYDASSIPQHELMSLPVPDESQSPSRRCHLFAIVSIASCQNLSVFVCVVVIIDFFIYYRLL